jgi:hypothetical protein
MEKMDQSQQQTNFDFRSAQERRAALIKSIQEKSKSSTPLTQEESELRAFLLEEERVDDQPERRGRY